MRLMNLGRGFAMLCVQRRNPPHGKGRGMATKVGCMRYSLAFLLLLVPIGACSGSSDTPQTADCSALGGVCITLYGDPSPRGAIERLAAANLVVAVAAMLAVFAQVAVGWLHNTEQDEVTAA